MQEKTIEKVRNFISSNQMLQNGILVDRRCVRRG